MSVLPIDLPTLFGHVFFKEMKDALLEVEDVNVIVVNWSRGASATYCQAVANTQLVGALIGNFINYGEVGKQIFRFYS